MTGQPVPIDDNFDPFLDPVATCIGCGCHDLKACVVNRKPCSWIRLDRDQEVGVCSCCPASVSLFDERFGTLA